MYFGFHYPPKDLKSNIQKWKIPHSLNKYLPTTNKLTKHLLAPQSKNWKFHLYTIFFISSLEIRTPWLYMNSLGSQILQYCSLVFGVMKAPISLSIILHVTNTFHKVHIKLCCYTDMYSWAFLFSLGQQTWSSSLIPKKLLGGYAMDMSTRKNLTSIGWICDAIMWCNRWTSASCTHSVIA